MILYRINLITLYNILIQPYMPSGKNLETCIYIFQKDIWLEIF
jgi:hypothetical protein